MDTPEIKSYRDLRVWQDAMNLAEVSYRLTKVFPRDEMFGLTSQIGGQLHPFPRTLPKGMVAKAPNLSFNSFVYPKAR